MTDSVEVRPTSMDISPLRKRRGSAKKMPHAKRSRRKSPLDKKPTPSPTSSTMEPMQWEAQFKRLDPEDPVQAKRIQHRRKILQKGKNTAGYDNYLQTVPKEKRIPRSMKTPGTPDPTLDISNKHFLGQVRAWRVALHKYDPPELVQASSQATTISAEEATEFRTPCKETANASSSSSSNEPSNNDSPISIMSESSRRDLKEEFEASLTRPSLITGVSNWADSDDDDL